MKPVTFGYCCCAALCVLAAVGGLVHLNQPSDGDSTATDWWSMLRAQQRRAEELDARLARVVRREALKDDIAAEVIAGQLTLGEAAARFRELNNEAPDFNWTAFRRAVPGRSDEERHCRLVIGVARNLLQGQPDRAEAIQARLEAELEQYLERNEDGSASYNPGTELSPRSPSAPR